MEKFFKDKKKVGVFAVLVIILVTAGILYLKNGYKELRKNDTDSIFVEESENLDLYSDNVTKSNENAKNSKEINLPIKDKNIVVEIKGEIKKPDVYTLNENSIIKDLIEMAGGLTENAEVSNINRAEKLQNHELIYIGNKNEKSLEGQNINSKFSTTNNQNINKKININTATIEELKTLNGIGDSKAKTIIEYREQNGGFKSVEDIKNVTGIGEKMFEKIKEQIVI